METKQCEETWAAVVWPDFYFFLFVMFLFGVLERVVPEASTPRRFSLFPLSAHGSYGQATADKRVVSAVTPTSWRTPPISPRGGAGGLRQQTTSHNSHQARARQGRR